jgi:hypothetical protein
VTIGATAPLVVLAHDWSSPVELERAYPTTVLGPQRNGAEQRLSLSGTAVETITYRLIAPDWRAAEPLRLLAQVATDAIVRMPRWEDQARVATAVSAGDTTIPCDPSDKPTYVAGSQVMLWRAPDEYEVATIDTVGTSSIDVVDPLASDWRAGTIVVPVQAVRVVLPTDLTNWVPVTAGAQRFVVTADVRDIAGVGTGGSFDIAVPAAISIAGADAVVAPTVHGGSRLPITATVTSSDGLVLPGTGLVWTSSDPVNLPITNTANPCTVFVYNPNHIADNVSYFITATLGAVSTTSRIWLR